MVSSIYEYREIWAIAYAVYLKLNYPCFEFSGQKEMLALLSELKLALKYFQSNKEQLRDYCIEHNLIDIKKVQLEYKGVNLKLKELKIQYQEFETIIDLSRFLVSFIQDMPVIIENDVDEYSEVIDEVVMVNR